MKTQRFQAPDIQAALRAVRNAMGPDAIIMTTRETPSGIEIIAGAVTGKAHRVPTMRGRKPRSSDASAWSSVVADLARPAPRSRVSIAHEAAKPVALVQVPTTSRVRASSRTNVSLGSELDALGLASDLKAAVLNDVRQSDTDNKWDAAVCSLTTRIPVQGNSLLKNGGRVVIVGGTGVGKTTTIAKLAAHFARMHGPRSVALVNTDSFRVGASEQLRRYAKLMGIGICNVRGPSDLGRAFEHLSGRKLVLVDTAGTNYQDTRLMEHLEELRNAGENVTCYLAASFNTQTSVLDKTVRAFGPLTT